MSQRIAKRNGAIDTNDTYILAVGSGDLRRRKITLQLTLVAGFDGNLTIVARAAGSSAQFLPVPYKKRYLNGVVADDTVASTAIVNDSLIEIACSGGEEPAIISAGRSVGSMTYDVAVENDL